MSGANYEYCPVCDTKALYVGEQDVPEGVVVLHQACLEKRASARDSGVRADPPGNAIDAGVAALLEANRKAGRSTNMTGYEYIIVGTILAAAAPVIAGKAARDERQARDAAYAERDQLVAALSKCFPSHLARHEGDDWEDDWRNIVCIHLPAGQATWHIHDRELPWFAHLPTGANHWDSHTTAEKYDRLAQLSVYHRAERRDFR